MLSGVHNEYKAKLRRRETLDELPSVNFLRRIAQPWRKVCITGDKKSRRESMHECFS